MPQVLQWSRTAILQQESPSHQETQKTSEREFVVPSGMTESASGEDETRRSDCHKERAR